MVSVLLLTNFFKLTLRKPRPYYLNVCDSDMHVRNSCKMPGNTSTHSTINSLQDVPTVFTSCHTTGFPQKVISEATLSMPSGHSSAATATCFYLLVNFCVKNLSNAPLSSLGLPALPRSSAHNDLVVVVASDAACARRSGINKRRFANLRPRTPFD